MLIMMCNGDRSGIYSTSWRYHAVQWRWLFILISVTVNYWNMLYSYILRGKAIFYYIYQRLVGTPNEYVYFCTITSLPFLRSTIPVFYIGACVCVCARARARARVCTQGSTTPPPQKKQQKLTSYHGIPGYQVYECNRHWLIFIVEKSLPGHVINMLLHVYLAEMYYLKPKGAKLHSTKTLLTAPLVQRSTKPATILYPLYSLCWMGSGCDRGWWNCRAAGQGRGGSGF